MQFGKTLTDEGIKVVAEAVWKKSEAPVDILVSNAGGPPPGQFLDLEGEVVQDVRRHRFAVEREGQAQETLLLGHVEELGFGDLVGHAFERARADHRINLPQVRARLDDNDTRDLAIAFGAPVVIDANVRDGSLRLRPIPALIHPYCSLNSPLASATYLLSNACAAA